MILNVEMPECYSYLFEPHRYKVAYGGRGSGKSWSYAKALIVLSMQNKHRILCGRELQNSINDSVHQLLRDQIEAMGVSEMFNITNKEIECITTGSIFKFKGLHHNIDDIKSFEGVTICWVEEAQNVSNDSWSRLIPTIFRTDNAELWISFNTGYEDDATFERFVKTPPDGAIVKKINYDQNPYMPKLLNDARLDDKANRPQEYANTWLGDPKGYGGKVWPQYIDTDHPHGNVRTFDWQLVLDTANCVMSCDPAQKYYSAMIWIAVLPINKRGKWPDDFVRWVYAESPDWGDFGDYFYKHRKVTLYPHGLDKMSAGILGKDSAGVGLKCIERYIDTRFATGSGGGNYWSNETIGLVEQFSKPQNGGLVFKMPSVKYIDAAKNDIVADLSCNRSLAVTALNHPKLFVAPWCKNVRYALSNHRVEEKSEKECEKLKDFSDCLKIAYAGLKDFRYKSPMAPVVNDVVVDYYSNSGGNNNYNWMC